MDADRFDSLTRTLTASRSRRVALGGLATALMTLGPALDRTTARAGKGKGKKGNKGNNKDKNKNDKKNKKDELDNIFDPDGCGTTGNLCGGQCCYWGLGQHCCQGNVCCQSSQGCADNGTC